MPEAQLQEIREAARAVVRAQAQAAEDAAVEQELANQAHRQQMATTAAAMTDAVERARRRRVAIHAAAVGEARICRERLATLASQSETINVAVGRVRADLQEIEKSRSRCPALGLDEYPTEQEVSEHKQRVDGFNRECHRLTGLIHTLTAEHGRALAVEDDARVAFQRAADAELEARNQL